MSLKKLYKRLTDIQIQKDQMDIPAPLLDFFHCRWESNLQPPTQREIWSFLVANKSKLSDCGPLDSLE